MRRFVQSFAVRDALPADLPATLAQALLDAPERYNIAVRKPAVVLIAGPDGALAQTCVWGLIPRWSPEPATPYTTVTARLERAPTSRIFRRPWQSQRCVVPMSGYYKWDRTMRPHVPHFIHASSGEVLLAAGLWEVWDKDGPPLHSFTVLTHPNAAIPAPLVPDGPLFLQADWAGWLTGQPADPARFLARLPQPLLESYAVSRAMRDPERDDYTLLEPAGMDEPHNVDEASFPDADDDEDEDEDDV